MRFIFSANGYIPFGLWIVCICSIKWMAFFTPRCSVFVGNLSALWTIIKKNDFPSCVSASENWYVYDHVTCAAVRISRSLAISHVCVIGCLRIGYWRTCCCHSNGSPFEGRIIGRAVASPEVLGALIWKYLVSMST